MALSAELGVTPIRTRTLALTNTMTVPTTPPLVRVYSTALSPIPVSGLALDTVFFLF